MRTHAWETWKLSHAYNRIGSGTTPTSSDARYYTDLDATPWVTTAELRENYISATQRQVTQEALENFPALRMYGPGSVMMAMYGATIGRLGMTEVAATCNQACCVFETSERFDNRFLFYWLWHRRGDLIALSVGGGQPNLSQQDLREERALCPPLDTQWRIARFLDEKTARIDGLIEKKRELLDRLAEKRQALITRAVTKGLNPDAPMKPSGIEWLGDIPAHWEMLPVMRIATLESGHTPDRKVDAYWEDCEIPWVSLNDTAILRDCDYVSDTTFRINWLGLANSSARMLPERAVVFTRDATIGESAITTRPMAVSQHIIAWLCDERSIVPEFLLFAIYGMKDELLRLTNGSTIGTIGLADVKSICVAVPPIEEQNEICSDVFRSKETLREVSNRVERSASALAEYRAALITAAVTGQLAELR